MLNESDILKLNRLRKKVDKEKKNLRITEPRFTFQMDSRTKKLTMSYSIHVDGGLDSKNNRIYRKKQVRKYLKNVTVDDVDVVLRNLRTYSDEILREQNVRYKSIGGSRDTMTHWLKVYVEKPKRKGNITVNEKTIRGDKTTIQDCIDWMSKHKP